MAFRSCVAAIAALVLSRSVQLDAQTRSPLELQRLTAPVTIDGVPNEPAWQAIPPLPMTMYAPVGSSP